MTKIKYMSENITRKDRDKAINAMQDIKESAEYNTCRRCFDNEYLNIVYTDKNNFTRTTASTLRKYSDWIWEDINYTRQEKQRRNLFND